MMQSTSLRESQAGQMLLATGVVLLMSLLSMAIFGVKVAGLTLPHEAASDDVIDTTNQVLVKILMYNRLKTVLSDLLMFMTLMFLKELTHL